MAADTLTNVAAEVTTESGKLGSGESALKVKVHVNGKSLSFRKGTTGGPDGKEGNVRAERLIFITALFDMQGHYLAGVEAVMDMNLKDATFAEISKGGVDAHSTLEAPPGIYRLREVVQEVVGGRLAASSQTVTIR